MDEFNAVTPGARLYPTVGMGRGRVHPEISLGKDGTGGAVQDQVDVDDADDEKEVERDVDCVEEDEVRIDDVITEVNEDEEGGYKLAAVVVNDGCTFPFMYSVASVIEPKETRAIIQKIANNPRIRKPEYLFAFFIPRSAASLKFELIPHLYRG